MVGTGGGGRFGGVTGSGVDQRERDHHTTDAGSVKVTITGNTTDQKSVAATLTDVTTGERGTVRPDVSTPSSGNQVNASTVVIAPAAANPDQSMNHTGEPLGAGGDLLDCAQQEVDMLTEGTTAPGFELPDQDGQPVSLSGQRGDWVLLWWYPMADTPG